MLSLYILLSFILVTLFSIVTVSIAEATDYVNQEHNINFEYPDEWKLYETLTIEEKKNYDKIIVGSLIPEPKETPAGFTTDPLVTLATIYNNQDPQINIITFSNMDSLEALTKAVEKELSSVSENIIDEEKIEQSGIQFNIISQSIDEEILGGYNENHYILFQNDNTGYLLIYEVPPEKKDKYMNDVFNLATTFIN